MVRFGGGPVPLQRGGHRRGHRRGTALRDRRHGGRDVQVPAQLHRVEKAQHRRLVGHEVQARPEQTRPVVHAQQAAEAGGVHERHAAQVDDQVVRAPIEQRQRCIAQRGCAVDVDLAGHGEDGVRTTRLRLEHTDHWSPPVETPDVADCFSASLRVTLPGRSGEGLAATDFVQDVSRSVQTVSGLIQS